MQKEEWISLNEYARRFKMHPVQVKKFISEGKIEYFRTEGGYYKIKVGGDTVSNDLYEKVVRENAELKTTIKNLKNILTLINV